MRKKIMNKIIEEITGLLSHTQRTLRQHITDTVDLKVTEFGYMIYSKTDVPKPMLCVHLDTINSHRDLITPIDAIKDFEYDSNLCILGLATNSKLACLGGDDRAGVWIALAIIEYMETTGDYKYDIGFFEDEEIGCRGSSAYSKNIGKVTDVNTSCYIGLDRKSTGGVQEMALYGDDNSALTEVFNILGYETSMGSVTDASNLAGTVACCNLSIGYDNEHTTSEVLYIHCMIDTLEKLKALELDAPVYPPDYDHYSSTTLYEYNADGYGFSYPGYIDELEEENEILKESLRGLGVAVESLLITGE
jgi:hypothetical protein